MKRDPFETKLALLGAHRNAASRRLARRRPRRLRRTQARDACGPAGEDAGVPSSSNMRVQEASHREKWFANLWKRCSHGKNGSRTLENGVHTPKNGSRTFENCVHTAKNGLRTLKNGVYTPKNGSRTFENRVHTAKNGLRTFKNRIHTIKNGSRISKCVAFGMTPPSPTHPRRRRGTPARQPAGRRRSETIRAALASRLVHHLDRNSTRFRISSAETEPIKRRRRRSVSPIV